MRDGRGADILFLRECRTYSASSARCAHMMCAGFGSAGALVRFCLCGVHAPGEARESGPAADLYRYEDLTGGPGNRPASLVRQFIAILGAMRASRRAIIVFYSVGLLFPFVAVAARLFGMRYAYVQGDRYTVLPGMSAAQALKMRAVNVLDRLLAGGSSLNILTGTSLLSARYRKIAPRTEVFQCFPPIDVEAFSGGPAMAGDARDAGDIAVISYFGTVGEIEGIGTLLEAFALLRKEGTEARLTIAGRTGPGAAATGDSEFERHAASLGLGASVEFTGLLGREEVAGAMHAADILVMPRTDHRRNRVAAPIKLSEYLAAGRAVVASRVGGLENEFEDGRELLLFAPGDAAELKEKLGRLVADPALRAVIAAEGQRVARERLGYRAWGSEAMARLGRRGGMR